MKMERTKQTPRNPVRDGPIIAVGSDLCSIEGRLPLRPTNQGRVSAPPPTTPRPRLKPQIGGKQPRKSTARKPPCLSIPSTGGIKKPHFKGLIWLPYERLEDIKNLLSVLSESHLFKNLYEKYLKNIEYVCMDLEHHPCR